MWFWTEDVLKSNVVEVTLQNGDHIPSNTSQKTMINRYLKRLKKVCKIEEDIIDVLITVIPSLIFRVIRRPSVTGSKRLTTNYPQYIMWIFSSVQSNLEEQDSIQIAVHSMEAG